MIKIVNDGSWLVLLVGSWLFWRYFLASVTIWYKPINVSGAARWAGFPCEDGRPEGVQVPLVVLDHGRRPPTALGRLVAVFWGVFLLGVEAVQRADWEHF